MGMTWCQCIFFFSMKITLYYLLLIMSIIFIIVVLINIALMTRNFEHLFICMLPYEILAHGILYIFLEEMSIQVLCPFLIELVVTLLLSCEFLIYSEYKPLMRFMIGIYFLPFCGLSFIFLDVLCGIKVFNFDSVQFIFFFC